MVLGDHAHLVHVGVGLGACSSLLNHDLIIKNCGVLGFWGAGWTGIRIDSGDPATGAEIAIKWWKDRGEDPTNKLIIFSDGLDEGKITDLHHQFKDRVKVSFGWGTMLTNDFKGLAPDDALAPFSLVCKAVKANGHPTVKLSDNPRKAMGPDDEIARYKRVFGVGAQEEIEVVV